MIYPPVNEHSKIAMENPSFSLVKYHQNGGFSIAVFGLVVESFFYFFKTFFNPKIGEGRMQARNFRNYVSDG